MNQTTQIFTPRVSTDELIRVRLPNTRDRLERGFSRLQGIQLVRNHRQDRFFGKSAEERIVWRELLDLELQDVDEQIERLSAGLGQAAATG